MSCRAKPASALARESKRPDTSLAWTQKRCAVFTLAAILIGLAWPESGAAQINLGSPIGVIANALQSKGISNVGSKPQTASEPSGFPSPPSSFPLPPPRDYGSDEKYMRIIKSGATESEGDHVHLEDGFQVRYKGYDIYGDTLDGDRSTEVFTATGHVKLIGIDQAIAGDLVTIDFIHNTYISQKMDVDLHPTFFPTGSVLGDIYFKGKESHGSEQEIFGDDADITTCNLDDPHYVIYARHVDLRPGRRIILRGVTLYILDKKILSIPYLSIPLDDRSNHIYPEIGDDPTAGYYIKLHIPIALHGNEAALSARLDEYSKLGTGVGLDYEYKTKQSSGSDELYTIIGKSNEQDATIQHEEKFGRSDFNLNATYSNNDYLTSPGSTLLNLRTQLSIPQNGGSVDQISIGDSSNEYSGFHSGEETLTLNDNRVWTKTLRTTLSLAYSDTTSSSSSAGTTTTGGTIPATTAYSDQLLDINFDAQDDLKKATAEFQYAQNIPIGSGSQALYGTLEQSPSITFKSDSTKLLGQKLGLDYPFQTDLSFGQYGTPSFTGQGMEDIWRTDFDFTYTRPDHPDRRFDYSFDTRFEQGIYSDDTAQYITGFDFSTRYNLGPDTAWNIHYNYLEQHGYTPIEQDNAGQTNLITSDLSFRPLRTLLVAAQTGYDMMAYQEGTPAWQTAGLRLEYTPISYLQMRALATYDTTLNTFSTIEYDLAWKPSATFVSLGAVYDNEQHTFGQWNLYVDALKWGRLKTSIILDYDGYVHQFTAAQISLTYDLHCAEAVLQILDDPTGFRSGTTVNFFLRLKAFPFNTPFGTGTQGQAVGAGFGRSTF